MTLHKTAIGKLLISMALVCAVICGPLPAHAAQSKTTISFSVAVDEAATVDRLVNCALQRLGTYDMDVEVFPMAYAIQMASSGEKDALVSQMAGLEEEYPGLVMVPEQVSEIRFEVYAREGFDKEINSWEELAGLRVGTMMHKTRIESQLPPDVAEHVYRESNTELIQALLADEFDVFIASVTLEDTLQTPDSIARISELERQPTYVYLNRRYEALVPAFAQAIADIKADGSYQEIIDHNDIDGSHQKSLLHISSYYADDPWEQELLDGVAGVLSADGTIQYENIALNANRSLNESNRSRTISSMVRTSYLNGAPDVVIASDNAAIQFVMDYYNILFFGTPVIFCGQNGDIDDQLWKVAGNMTGIYEAIPAAENVRMVLYTFPETKCLYILNDYSTSGTGWRREFEKQLEAMPETEGVDIIYSPEAALSEIIGQVRALPPDSAVLCGAYSFDSNREYYSQKELQTTLASECSLPIFGMSYGSIGYGQVGGKYVEPGLQGKSAAGFAMEVLNGRDISTIPTMHQTQSFNRWVFDGDVLECFDVDEDKLPSGSSVINKPPTLYESNPRAFIFAVWLFLLALLAIMVLGVLVATIRKKNKRLLEMQKNLHSTEEMLEKDREIVAMAQRLEIALAASNSGAWEINARTQCFHYDKTIAKALRIPSGECVSIALINDILSGTQDGFVNSDFQQALLAADLVAIDRLCPSELTFTAPDGTKRYYNNYTKVMANDDGEAECVIGLLLDVTSHIQIQQELREAKEAAESANHAKSQFLSSMSHEIRTPMNAIIGMTDLLSTEPLTDKQVQFVHDIRTSADWLLGIINDLLDLAKIESGKLELVPVNYSLGELLENLGSMFAYAAFQKGITFTYACDGPLPEYVFGDDVRVRQILINIINNAIKYTPEGLVEFHVRCDGANLHYSVTDTGIGIKKENLSTIFDDYAQFDLRRNRSMDSTGLGLAITKRLVDQMDGDIRIDSVYGKGTKVDVILPYVAGAADESATESVESFALYAPDAKILVVDDKEINLKVASGLLERFGVHCHMARSGPEAIEKIHNIYYDLVFMDQMMPDMDGIETTQALRAGGFTSDVLPIIALTANAVSSAREELLSAGMDDFLSKPISLPALGKILKKWLPPSLVHLQENGGEKAEELPLSPLLNKAQKIEAINVRHALLIIGGSQDAYQELLKLTVLSLPGNIDTLERCLADGDLKRLGIEAHGVKSAFAHIGADGLAAKALEIEEHAQAGDGSFCREALPALLGDMEALQKQLQELLPAFDTAEEKKPGDLNTLEHGLTVLREYIDGFDYDAAKSVLEQLTATDFGEDLNGMLAQAENLVDLFDFSAAAMLLDEMDKTIGGSRQ